jgi:hypothetical protein
MFFSCKMLCYVKLFPVRTSTKNQKGRELDPVVSPGIPVNASFHFFVKWSNGWKLFASFMLRLIYLRWKNSHYLLIRRLGGTESRPERSDGGKKFGLPITGSHSCSLLALLSPRVMWCELPLKITYTFYVIRRVIPITSFGTDRHIRWLKEASVSETDSVSFFRL